MNDKPKDETSSKSMDELDRVVADLSGIGKLWARHGLNMGRAALETSATTLRTTAALLGRLADGLERQREERAAEVEPEHDRRTDETETGA